MRGAPVCSTSSKARGVRGMVVNNLIYNPGPRAVHYNLIAEEWRGQPYQAGQMALIGNVLRGGPNTPPGLALFMLGGSGDVFADLRHSCANVGRRCERGAQRQYVDARVLAAELRKQCGADTDADLALRRVAAEKRFERGKDRDRHGHG